MASLSAYCASVVVIEFQTLQNTCIINAEIEFGDNWARWDNLIFLITAAYDFGRV